MKDLMSFVSASNAMNANEIFFAARFSPIEAKRLNAAIRQAGQSKTDWMRKALQSAAGSDKSAS
jgi:hypothetical protein